MDDTAALEGILANLDSKQSARLLSAVRDVTSRAQSEWGLVPNIGEVLALTQVKESVYGDYDIDNAIFQLKRSPSVQSHLATAASPPTPGLKKTGKISEIEFVSLPARLQLRVRPGAVVGELDSQTKMAIARALASTERRNPDEIQKFEDSRAVESLSPADKITRHRKNGGV